MKPHHAIGNKNAAKPDDVRRSAFLCFRCTSSDKEAWKKYVKEHNMSLTDLANYSINLVVKEEKAK